MSSSLQGSQNSLVAELHPGTQVLFRWAKWQKQQAYPRPILKGVFRKEELSLVIYQYGFALCVALLKGPTTPKIRDFREWRQSYAIVKGKLVQRGWQLEEECVEVRHVAH